MSTAEASSPLMPSLEDDAIGRSALRKASLRLLPLIGIGYGIAYMDRVNVSFAALQMNRALGFSASVYGLGAGLFFLSYAACEIPSNLLLVRLGARRWLARIMFTWGLLSIAMIFVRTPREFYLTRLALGAAEAGFFPGVIFYLSQWYPHAARSRAISRFYIAFPLSSVVMGGLAGMLLNLNGRFGLAGWQWLFLIEGLPAILMSVLFLRFLPDSPPNAPWLSQDERGWIITQLQNESSHISHDASTVRRAFREPRVWLLGTFLFCLFLGSYGYTFISPTIIQQITGFSTTAVGLIIAIIGALGAIAMLFNGWHSDRRHDRYFHILIPTILMALALLVAGLTLRPLIALPAYALIVMAFSAYQPPMWTLPPTFLAGKSAAAGIAAINTMAICGGFFGPWWMGVAHDITGSYQRGLLTLAVPALIAGILISLFAVNSRRKSSTSLGS